MRYSVSVPDELGERIEKWKHKVSPSAVFKDAMGKAIDSEERFENKLKGDNMEAIIERLKAEKKDAENNYRQDGKEYGLEWAKNAKYKAIRRLLSEKEGIEEFFYNYWRVDSDYVFGKEKYVIVANDVVEHMKEDPILREVSEAHGMTGWYLGNEGSEWFIGFLEGVQAFWDEVEYKL